MQYMMIKKGMRSLCDRALLAFSFAFCIQLEAFSQVYQQFREKEDACIEFQRQKKWAEAAEVCNEIIALPINSKDSLDRRFKYKGDALFRLGHYYYHAHYFKYDKQKAIWYFEEASKYGTYFHMPELYLVLIYNVGKYGVCDYEKSLYWLQKGAEKHSIMNYLLGEVYEFGFTNFVVRDKSVNVFKYDDQILAFPNVEKQTRKAYKCFLEFFDKGGQYINDAKISKYDVGKALKEGIVVEQDYEKAFELLFDFVPSFHEFENDASVSKTPEVADAYFLLSQLCRFGNGTTANELRANQYLKYAALCGSEAAQKAISSSHIDIDF